MPNTEPPDRQRRRGARGARPGPPAHCATWPWRGPSPGLGGRAPGAHGASWPRSACGCSPTTAPASRTGRLMRRALEYARGLGVTLAQHCEDASLGGGGTCTRVRGRAAWACPAYPPLPRSHGGAGHLALVRPDRDADALPPSLDGRVGRAGAQRPRRRACPVTAEATPHHLTLTDAELAGLRPGLQGQPSLAGACGRARRPAGAARTGPSTRSPPITLPMPRRPRSCAFDRRAPGHARARDRPGGGTRGVDGSTFALEGVRTPRRGSSRGAPDGAALGLEDLLARLTWLPARIAGLTERQGGPVEPGRPANLCVFDPSAEWVVDPARLASRSRNTPLAGCRLTGGSATRCVYRREPTVVDDGGPAMSRERPTVEPALLVLADGEVFEGEAAGCRAPGRGGHRGAGLQHGAAGLPGGYHGPLVRRAGDRLHLPPHRQLRDEPDRLRSRARPPCRGVVVRDLIDTPRNWRRRARARAVPAEPRGPRRSPASTPAA